MAGSRADEPVLCRTLALSKIMQVLAESRPVFHSEADFQFAFAQTVAELDRSIEVRLEVGQPGAGAQSR